MAKRVDLVALQGELRQAETRLARSTTLHDAKIITDDDFELAKNARRERARKGCRDEDVEPQPDD